jgi:4-amino-4-deoxy-L-arabinose transferase-like glycosyltransferase
MTLRVERWKYPLIALFIWIVALIPRVYGLGGFITIDEIKWIEGAGQFTNALLSGQLAQTYWHFFPGITTTWGESLLLLVGWRMHGGEPAAYIAGLLADPARSIGFFRLSGAVLTSAISPLVFMSARRFFNDWSAALAGAFIALNPFFLAHSRLVNGDALAAGLMLLSLLTFLQLYRRPSMLIAAASGVFGGLALLTKLPSPLIVPCIFLIALMGGIAERPRRRFWLKASFYWCLFSALTFIVLFPALWVNPLGTIQSLVHDTFAVGEADEGHSAFFLGGISNDPGWGFYPYAIAFRLTPLGLLGLLIMLVSLIRVGKNRSQERSLAIGVLLAYVLFVYAFGSLSPKKLDRYLMAVIPALDILSAVGFGMLLEECAAKWPAARSKLLSAAFWLGLSAVLAIAWVIPFYPYYLGYYNPLMGGLAAAAEQVPVGWGEGLEKGAEWLNNQPNAENLLVSAWYSDSFFPFFRGNKVSFSSSGKGQLSADYVVFYINQVQRQNPDPAVIAYFRRQEPVYVYALYGTPITWVYRAPKMQAPMPKTVKINGLAELLGYTITATPTTVNRELDIRFFLKPMGKLPPDARWQASLQDSAGENVLSILADFPAWSTDNLADFTIPMRLPSGLKDGDYRLSLGLWDNKAHKLIAAFALPEKEGRISIMTTPQ